MSPFPSQRARAPAVVNFFEIVGWGMHGMLVYMDQETKHALEALDSKLNAIYTSVEKTRKYFLMTMIVSVVMFVLPLIALAFVVPMFLGTLTTSYGEVFQ